MRFNQEFIDQVRNSNDIVDVISGYISLKRSGRNYFGCCPFHNEKTPSFSVSPDKQIFKCFGCGIGGNVYTFIQNAENLSFVEAVEQLANRANIPVPKISNSYNPEKEALKEKVFNVNMEAAKFYHERLYDKSVAKPAQDYVKLRKLNNETLKAYMIGYSGTFNELYNHLRKKGFEDPEILETGLVNKADNGKYYDRYRNRLMFPICDVRGKVIAFGGRVLDNSKPKYINSPENIVYSKGNHLYGLNVAKKYDTQKLLIVEGYMDVISCHQRGVKNIVAALGTALTEKQGYLLKNHAKQIILSFDSDSAGQTAIDRSIYIMENMGITPRVLQLDNSKDPDEYIIKNGKIRFEQCVDNAISVIEFKIKKMKEKYNLENTIEKAEFLSEISKEISKLKSQLEQEVYVDKISKEYDVSKEAIYSELNKLKYKTNSETKNKVVKNKNTFDFKNLTKNLKEREKILINVLITGNYDIYCFIKQVLETKYSEDNVKAILEEIYNQYENNKAVDTNILMQELTVEQQSILSEILIDDFKIDNYEKALDKVLLSYEKEKYKVKKQELLYKIEHEENKEKIKEYEKQLQEVFKNLK